MNRLKPNEDILPEEIGKPSSFLTDIDICKAIKTGYLLKQDTADLTRQIKYASYELGISGRYSYLTTNKEGNVVNTEVPESEEIEIKPGMTVQIYTIELIKLPKNVVAKVTTIGQIFARGLCAENTFADPGFNNYLYITLTNASDFIVTLKKDKPIARIEFYKLGSEVQTGHSGAPRSVDIINSKPVTRFEPNNYQDDYKKILDYSCNKNDYLIDQNSHAALSYIIKKQYIRICWLIIAISVICPLTLLSIYLHLRPLSLDSLVGKIETGIVSLLVGGLTALALWVQRKVFSSARRIAKELKS